MRAAIILAFSSVLAGTLPVYSKSIKPDAAQAIADGTIIAHYFNSIQRIKALQDGGCRLFFPQKMILKSELEQQYRHAYRDPRQLEYVKAAANDLILPSTQFVTFRDMMEDAARKFDGYTFREACIRIVGDEIKTLTTAKVKLNLMIQLRSRE